MSLSVTVGLFSDVDDDPAPLEDLADDIDRINVLLAKRGFGAHTEPRQFDDSGDRSGLVSYPYSFLHYLRRFYAHCVHQPQYPPPPLMPGADPAADPVLAVVASPGHHLLWHSDCEGYYVPVEFSRVIESSVIPGDFLGSSQRLLAELVLVAPALGISLQDGVLDDTQAEAIATLDDPASEPLGIERTVWLNLFEAARRSVEGRALIVFG